MQNLFVDLDALSNFRFTPKPVRFIVFIEKSFLCIFIVQAAPEVTIVNNLPAILVEEIVPSTVNDSTLLAPEEIHVEKLRFRFRFSTFFFSFAQKRPKGDVKAATERTETDKKHARRLKKHKLKLKSANEPKKGENEEKEVLLKKLGKMKNVRIEKVRKKRDVDKRSKEKKNEKISFRPTKNIRKKKHREVRRNSSKNFNNRSAPKRQQTRRKNVEQKLMAIRNV